MRQMSWNPVFANRAPSAARTLRSTQESEIKAKEEPSREEQRLWLPASLAQYWLTCSRFASGLDITSTMSGRGPLRTVFVYRARHRAELNVAAVRSQHACEWHLARPGIG